MSTGYIVFAHGSSIASANQAVHAVAADFALQGGYPAVQAAFLEGGTPSLQGAVEALAGRGIRHFVVLPYFLTLGLHLQRDLPRLVEQVRDAHPGISIEVMAPLDGHPALVEALLGRARETEERESRASEVD